MPDLLNALFEFGGALIILLNVKAILRDKLVRGFDWRVLAFFTAWGAWNLFYYPHLDQILSTIAASALFVINTIYLVLVLKYRRN